MRINTLLVFIVFILSLSASAQTPNKVALIVAVSNYDPSTGWDNLSSEADVKLVTEALKKQGFKSENIAILRDKDADLNGITSAIDKYLTGKVKKDQDDIAVFHFSGHGQQMMDDNGDEGDGLDEALVPYDAPLAYNPNENKHLRDDLLEKKLNEVRLALGSKGSLLVVVDACHSGTSTRGSGKTRGSTRIYAPSDYVPKKELTTSENFGITGAEEDMAPMTGFFASGPFEQNAEASLPGGEGCGSLSLAFSRALSKADRKMSYKALFEDIKIQMSALVPQQTPMAEGDLDTEILGGNVLPKTSYYLLEKKDDILTIPVGTLYGIYEGTTVKLYPADTRDTARTKPIARGKITSAGVYSSIVELEKQLTASDIQRSWLYLDEVNFGDLVVQVGLNIADNALTAKVKSAIADINQMKLNTNAADLYIQTGKGFSADSVYI
ncbi:MAG TPA: caspase family protein, partial [Chitinophagaceae bacterium]